MTTFRDIVAKWNGLMEDIGDDKELYIETLQREVYDKI